MQRAVLTQVMLLRTLSEHPGETSPVPGEASPVRTPRGDRDSEAPPSPAVLVRGFSNHRTTSVPEAMMGRGPSHESLAELVVAALKRKRSAKGWHATVCSEVKVEDVSGQGGSQTYRVTAEGADPVALHSRNESTVSDPISEPRMKAAATALVGAKMAPPRLAYGGDW